MLKIDSISMNVNSERVIKMSKDPKGRSRVNLHSKSLSIRFQQGLVYAVEVFLSNCVTV